MRLALPPREVRQHIVAGLMDFYEHRDRRVLRDVLRALADWYHQPAPIVELRQKPLRGVYARTYDTKPLPRIKIVAPEVFERMQPTGDYPQHGPEEWVDIMLHELGHCVLYVHAEEKADEFAMQFQHGVGNR